MSAVRRMGRAVGRDSRTWRLKQLLASLIAVGSLGSVTATGTFAVLNSEARNAGSSAATGTLTFGNAVDEGSLCYSYEGAQVSANVNDACDALVTSSTLRYPGTAVTPAVEIVNNGSLDASRLSLYLPGCTAGDSPGAPSPGSGNPCGIGGLELYVQETDAAGAPTRCWFPTSGTTCSFVGSSLYVFSVNATNPATALSLGAGPAAGESRRFEIGIRLPPTAANALQGRAATFSLVWHMTA